MGTYQGNPILTSSLLIFRESIRSFQANGGFGIAAALATRWFFVFLPLLFFLGYLFGNYDIFSLKVVQSIDRMIFHMFPRTERSITIDLYFFTTRKITWAFIGLTLVIFPAMSLTAALQGALQRIFRVPPDPSFLRTKILNLRAALMMVLFFITLIIAEALYAGLLGKRRLEAPFFSETIPTFAGALLFMLALYVNFPPRRLGIRQLLAVALPSAGLILAMREIFSFSIRFNPGFGLAFGSLKTLFILILWVYSCFSIILFGAELLVNISRREALVLKSLFLEPGRSRSRLAELLKKFSREYAAGEVVFHQGEGGDCLYYILSGSVTITRKEGLIRTMGPGDYFGEMSMLLNARRMASVTAAEPATQLIVISRDNFEVILQDNPPIVLEILKEMTRRLKKTSREKLNLIDWEGD
jgi:membrane protein